MKKKILFWLLLVVKTWATEPNGASSPAPVDPANYLAEVAAISRVDWPKNRAVMIVCHGHSVPAGYFKTPVVNSLGSYPHHLRVGLAEKYPHAVINVVVTAIGGEDSEKGLQRFERDVMSLRPDVVTIDYGLNDRGMGLERAARAWRAMIERAQAGGAKVILLTPTPDTAAKWSDPADKLAQHAAQIRTLAREYQVALVDSYAAFQRHAMAGGVTESLMSQRNHPNEKGHALVSAALLAWFP